MPRISPISSVLSRRVPVSALRRVPPIGIMTRGGRILRLDNERSGVAEASDTGAVPRFASSLVGYDRYQVDDYVHRLLDWAADADERAAEAELRAAARDEELRDLRSRVEPEPEEIQAPGGRGQRFASEPFTELTEALDRFAGVLERLEQDLNGSGGS
jgi:hypothetical protein